MGLSLSPVPERFEWMEETLRIARRRTLRLVAEYADAGDLFDIPDGGRTVRGQLDVLARHCADVGRPLAEIEKTVATRWVRGSPQRTSPVGAPTSRPGGWTTPW